MGAGVATPRYYQPNQKIVGRVNPMMIPIGYKATKIGTEKQYSRSQHLGEGEFRNEVFSQKEYDEQLASDEAARKSFIPTFYQGTFQSSMKGFKSKDVDVFQLQSMYEDKPPENQIAQTPPESPEAKAQRERKEKFAGLGGGSPNQIQSVRNVRARGRTSLRTSALGTTKGSGIAIKGYA